MDGIKLLNIRKKYSVNEKVIPVLEGINLEIPKGEITVVLGRSGCGKTTLLRVAGRIEEPDAGQIISAGKKDKIAVVFQEPRLMPWLNVWENVRFGSLEYKTREEIQFQIDRVGLNGFEKAYPNQLSGGMQQRVSIARAFMSAPTFIMMDEPFAALDYFTREQMQKEVLRIQKESGVSILFVTHSIDEALLLGNKIVVLEDGRTKSEFRIETKNRDLMDSEFILQKKRIMDELKDRRQL